MNHTEFRAWLLEASPGALLHPPREFGEHLAECRACSNDLRTVLDATAAIAADRSAASPLVDSDEAVRLARSGRQVPEARRWQAGLAAAAAGVAFLAVGLLRQPADGPVGPPPAAGDPPGAPPMAVVEAEGRVAVFTTPNPRIHVVWMMSPPTTDEEAR